VPSGGGPPGRRGHRHARAATFLGRLRGQRRGRVLHHAPPRCARRSLAPPRGRLRIRPGCGSAGRPGPAAALPRPTSSQRHVDWLRAVAEGARAAAGSQFNLPPAAHGAAINRSAFLVEGPKAGPGARVGGQPAPAGGRASFELRGDAPCLLENAAGASDAVHVLVLQGRPIGEPVAQAPSLAPPRAHAPACSHDPCRARFARLAARGDGPAMLRAPVPRRQHGDRRPARSPCRARRAAPL